MGIRGLTTYINNRSDYYFEPYELQNTYLIIDGWSLSSQLYCNLAKCNCAFGGDYDNFSHTVTQFFENLLRCQVTPIVLLDGGWENKKRLTVFNRAREKLSAASNFGPSAQNGAKYFPLLLGDVFKNVLVRLKIKFVMCPFEADDCIAAVARTLEAPVLSYDSDFYIYGVMYIPFNTLDPFIIKNKCGYAKRCKIYRVEKLLSRFEGLDASLLPLASILLGNDYIKRSTFKKFFSKLKLPKSRTQNEQQRRIKTTLNWLKNYSLNSAVGAVLKKLPKERRQKVLNSIETIINGYTNLATYMMQPLGLMEIYKSAMKENQSKIFKFQGNLDKLEQVEEELKNEGNEESDSDEEDEEEFEEEPDILVEEKFTSFTPEWFIKDHLAGNFPAYLINMMTHRIYILNPQVEDFSQTCSHDISIPIISVIFRLLVSGSGQDNHQLELVIREGYNFKRRIIEVPEHPIPFKNLRQVDFEERKKIIDQVLEISGINELRIVPDNWRLYLATIIYWMKQKSQLEKTNIHLNCFLIGMLFGVIDEKIGFWRSRNIFEKKFGAEIERIHTERKIKKNSVKQENVNCSLDQAIKSVDKEDCLIGANFLISHFEMDEKLKTVPKRFCIKIVHAFAQFQSCLRHSIQINALLGYPYVDPFPGELFNGTLLYNLYNDLLKRNNILNYIHVKLENSPNLFKIFQNLHNIMNNILVNVAVEKTNNCKRRRNRNKKKREETDRGDEDEYMTAESDFEIPEKNQHFFDPKNPFSMLTMF